MRPATAEASGRVISLMRAVPDAPTAVGWYKKALGATELWNLGSVAGLEIAGAPFFLHEPTSNGFDSPVAIGATTVRVEVFVDDPDTYVERAIKAGGDGAPAAVGVARGGRLWRSVLSQLARRRQVSPAALPGVGVPTLSIEAVHRPQGTHRSHRGTGEAFGARAEHTTTR